MSAAAAAAATLLLLQASCWGVTWHQPLIALPALPPATAGFESLKPQGAFVVDVQQPLPLLRVRACVWGGGGGGAAWVLVEVDVTAL